MDRSRDSEKNHDVVGYLKIQDIIISHSTVMNYSRNYLYSKKCWKDKKIRNIKNKKFYQ